MYDSLEFENGFEGAGSDSTIEFSSIPNWHVKDVNPPEDGRQFRVREDGAVEQKLDGMWNVLSVSTTGTFYKSVDGKYYAFEIVIDNGDVTDITLVQEGEP